MGEPACESRLRDLRAVHGGVLLIALPVLWLVPSILFWPWYLLIPLLLYFLVVFLIKPLRRSISWIQAGRMDRIVMAAMTGIMVVSIAALLGFEWLFHPHLEALRTRMPQWMREVPFVGGIVFAVVNALLEEAIFRGILLDALASQIGMLGAVTAQAFVFGLLHKEGYPPGAAGMILATVYGLMLGWLRVRSSGLVGPCLAHMAADATIFAIVTITA